MDPQARPQPPARDDLAAPRLGALAPARLGRAADLLHQDRRQAGRRGLPSSRPASERPYHGRIRRGGRRRLVSRRRQGPVPDRPARPGRLRSGHRHPRRLVRFRLDPRLHPARPGGRHGGRHRRRLSGGHRPASRLVPLLPPARLRHHGPRALPGRRDPRLHARRQGQQDVQVGRQHRGAGQDRAAIRRRHPAPLGRAGGLHQRPPYRRRDPQGRLRQLPTPAQHAALRARLPARGGASHAGGRARAGAVRPAPDRAGRRRGARRLRRLRLPGRMARGG